jgi:hypothetical protein
MATGPAVAGGPFAGCSAGSDVRVISWRAFVHTWVMDTSTAGRPSSARGPSLGALEAVADGGRRPRRPGPTAVSICSQDFTPAVPCASPRLSSSWQERGARDEPACRPGSVSVRLAATRSATIHLGLPLPTASCGLPASSGGPPSNARAGARVSPGPLLDLAPGGVCLAAPVTRSAGGLLHHRFTLTVHPAGAGSTAVCFLWHCPAGHPGWVLPTTLPCGARTFLDELPRRGRPADSSASSLRALRARSGPFACARRPPPAVRARRCRAAAGSRS